MSLDTQLAEILERRHGTIRVPNPGRGNQMRFDMPQARLAIGYSPKSKQLNAYLLLRHAENPEAVFDALRSDLSFAEEVPEEPEWWEGQEGNPGAKFSFAVDHESDSARERGLERCADLVAAVDAAMRKRFGESGV